MSQVAFWKMGRG